MIPEIRTERMVLCSAVAEDAPAIAEFYARNDEHFKAYLPPLPDNSHTLEYWAERIEKERLLAQEGSVYRFWAYLLDGVEPVGMVVVRSVNKYPNSSCEIGYAFDQRYCGAGLASEATAALVEFCFDSLRMHRVEACYMPRNAVSARVLAKLGFEVEGILRGLMHLNGVWEDHAIASKINPNWKELPSA